MTRHPVPRLVVVGDALLDRDVVGTAERLSPDAPVPVLDEQASISRPGGAALAATLAAMDGEDVAIVAPTGPDGAGDELRRVLMERGVEILETPTARRTPEKIRLLAQDQPLLRLDRGGAPSPLDPLPRAALLAVETASVVLVSDYGRGVTADGGLRAALARRRRPTVWDPHPRGSTPVAGTTLVTPNLAELERIGRPAAIAEGSTPVLRAVAEAAEAARDTWQVQAVATTLGPRGALLVDGEGPPLAVPAEPAGSGDACGAGDRFAATVATLLLHGALVSEAVTDAVAVASRFVASGGVRALPSSLSESRPGEIGLGEPPTVPVPFDTGRLDAASLAEEVREHGGVVVVAGGCFDLLHAGHLALLQAARRLGDCLIVALNSDASVRRLKGPGRPIVPQSDRVALLSALSCVDAVAVFDEDAPTRLLACLRPHVFAKGGDYSSRPLLEEAVLAGWAGQTVVLPYLSGRSTTSLLRLAGGRT